MPPTRRTSRMKVDAMLGTPLHRGRRARALELEMTGYSGGWTIEAANDPFLPLVLAAEHTTPLELGTAIAVAFARNPMTLAQHCLGPAGALRRPVHPRTRVADQAAHHQALLDAVEPPGGADARVDPGDPGDLGHVAHRRTAAVPRRVLHAHADDAVLLARPQCASSRVGVPRIFLAGVGPAMTEVAGEVADGFICHPFTTERYLREVTLPALAAGPGARPARTSEGSRSAGRASSSPAANDEERAPPPIRRRASSSPSTARRRPTAPCSSCTVGATCRTSSTGSPRPASGRKMGELIDDEMLGGVRRRRRARGRRRRAWPSATATSSRESRWRSPTAPTPTAGPPSSPPSTPDLIASVCCRRSATCRHVPQQALRSHETLRSQGWWRRR